MAIKRYQSKQTYEPGANPFYKIGQGVSIPSAPSLTPPPAAPNLRRPRTSPAQAKSQYGGQAYQQLSSALNSFAGQMAGFARAEAQERGFKEGTRDMLRYVFQNEEGVPEAEEGESAILREHERLTGESLDYPILPKGMGAYSRAYREGALLAHEQAYKNDIRTNLERLRNAHNTNPEGFEDAVRQYTEGLMGEAPADMRDSIPGWVAEIAVPYQAKVEGAAYVDKREQQLGTFNRALTNLGEDSMSAARTLDEDKWNSKAVEYHAILYSMVNNDLISESAAEELYEEFNDALVQQIIMGEFESAIKTGGMEAGTAYRDRIEVFEPREMQTTIKPEDRDWQTVVEERLAGEVNATHLDIRGRDSVVTKMDAELGGLRAEENRADSLAAAQQRIVDEAAKEQFDQFKIVSKNFDNLSTKEIEVLTEQMRDTKYWNDFKTELNLYSAQEQFQGMSWESREMMLTALQAIDYRIDLVESDDQQSYEQERPATLEEQSFQSELYDRLVTYHNKQKARIDNGQGLEVALEEGVVQDLEPYYSEMTDQERVGWLQLRNDQAKTAEQFYGRDVNRFRDGEITQIAREFDHIKSPDEILSFMSMMVEGLGADVYPVLNRFIEDGGLHNPYAVAGSLMLEEQFNGHVGEGKVARPTEVAREILNGMKFRNQKFISGENESYVRQYVQAKLGDAFRGDVDNLQGTSIEDAVLAVMAYRSLGDNPSDERMEILEGGDQIKDGSGDTKKMIDSAINDVMGGIMEFEWAEQSGSNPTYQLPAPQRGMDGDGWKEYFGSLTNEDITRMGGLSFHDWSNIKDSLPGGTGDETMRLVYGGVRDGRHGYFIMQANGLYVPRSKWLREMGPPPATDAEMPAEMRAQPSAPFVLYFDPKKEVTQDVATADARAFYTGSPSERIEATVEGAKDLVRKGLGWLGIGN